MPVPARCRGRIAALTVAFVSAAALAEMPEDYRTLCAPCHGLEADGHGPSAPFLFPPPPSLRDETSRALSDDELLRVLRDGGKATGRSAAMPAFGKALGRQRLQALVRYVRSLPTQTAAAGTLTRGAGRGGADLFAAHCQDCHGPEGKGDGRNAPLLPVRPRPLAASAARGTEAQVRAAIAGGTWWSASSMPPFGSVLSEGAILELARHLRGRAPDPVATLPDPGSAATGREIFQRLGCAGCHVMEGASRQEHAPDLGAAATTLRPSYLLSFLRKPTQVRPLGRPAMSFARMPDFHLTEAEARDIATALAADPAPAVAGKPDRSVVASFGCLACHRMGGEGGTVGPDLDRAATRLRAGAVEDALLGRTLMPRQDVSPHDVRRLTTALLGGQQRDAFRIGSEGRGRLLMEDLACRACHPIPGIDPPPPVGPELTHAGERFSRDFLVRYLAAPTPRRPALAARMPDFRLTPREIDALADFLMEERKPPRALPPAVAPGAPASRDEIARGQAVYSELKCGTCHGLAGAAPTGSQNIGPTLDRIHERLTWEGLTRWLLEPSRYVSGTAMPAFFEVEGRPLDERSYERLRLVRAFLWEGGGRVPVTP